MAPHQDDCWDGDAQPALLLPTSLHASKEEAATTPSDGKSMALVSESPRVPMTPRPRGILRRSSTATPSHWPKLTVHFPADVVADVQTRPRTHILDVPGLYYSAQDIRQFKREYRRIVARARNMTRASNGGDSQASAGGERQKPQHDNSYWRSRVGRRWTQPPSNSSSAIVREQEKPAEDTDAGDAWDPLNDGSAVTFGDETSASETTTSSYAGMFSSVFDVAREAVSILNGPSSSRSYGQSTIGDARPRKLSNTSIHLVDTLYLF